MFKLSFQKGLIDCSTQNDDIKYIKNNVHLMAVIVKQRLCSLPFLSGSSCSIFSFLCSVLYIFLSFCLRFTSSNYPIRYHQVVLVQYLGLDPSYSVICWAFRNLQLCILSIIWYHAVIVTVKKLAIAQWKALSRWNGHQSEFFRLPGHIISG